MTHRQILNKLMKSKKLSTGGLANGLGKKSNASVWKWLNRNETVKLDTFLEVLDYFGYEAVIRPQGKKRTKYKLTRYEE